MWNLPNGQMLNILTLIVGVIALAANFYRFGNKTTAVPKPTVDEPKPLFVRKLLLAVICILPLVIPSDATRDIPATYGQRHSGLEHSWMYPNIAAALAEAENEKEGRK